MLDENDEVDVAGLAQARWLWITDALVEVLSLADPHTQDEISVMLEVELGLRPLVTVLNTERPSRSAVDWKAIFNSYERAHEDLLGALVPRMERALACCPERWLDYVQSLGRSCFDPVELSAAAAVAKRCVEEPVVDLHPPINAILHWCWDCLLGQRPIPQVRQAPSRGHPTLLIEIVGAIERIEVNWRSLGLRPVVTEHLVVRWDEYERWHAWVQLVRLETGATDPHVVLRLRSDGSWRILRLNTK